MKLKRKGPEGAFEALKRYLNARTHISASGVFSRAKTYVAVLLLTLFVWPAVLCPASCAGPAEAEISDNQPAAPSVTCIQKLGLSGTVTSDVVAAQLAADGPGVALVGTSDGLYAVSGGVLQTYIYTPFGVSHIALLDDTDGDGVREVVFSLESAGSFSI